MKIQAVPPPRPTAATTPEADYLHKPNRPAMTTATERRALAALAKLGNSDEVLEAIITRTGLSPTTVARLAGFTLDVHTPLGQRLVSAYNRRSESNR